VAAVAALKYPLIGLGMCCCCLIVYLKPETLERISAELNRDSPAGLDS
jgi:hypothetical protein